MDINIIEIIYVKYKKQLPVDFSQKNLQSFRFTFFRSSVDLGMNEFLKLFIPTFYSYSPTSLYLSPLLIILKRIYHVILDKDYCLVLRFARNSKYETTKK